MNGAMLQANIEALRELAQSRGWVITEEKAIQSGCQLVVTDGVYTVPAAFYASGKALIQGRTSELRAEIQAWWDRRHGQRSPASDAELQVSQPLLTTDIAGIPTTPVLAGSASTARIGLDESGKGDYFGPLTIGAAYVDASTEQQLMELGVRDSKQLADKRILALARDIEALCPWHVVIVEPERYNKLYEKIGNLNILLARGHALALETLLEKVSCPLAIVDQFGNEAYILKALREKGRQIRIEQRPRAEEDIAVAAASILARAAFVQQMEELARRVGQTLSKGAWDQSIVATGREIFLRGGKEALGGVAKIHFKITDAIIGALENKEGTG